MLKAFLSSDAGWLQDPKHANNLGGYADLLLKKGENAEAARFFRMALNAGPANRDNLER